MAGELRITGATGNAINALILDENGLMWDGSDMVGITASVDDAGWTAALIAMTEQPTLTDGTLSGLYLADWPGGLTQDAIYSVDYYEGAAPTPGSLVWGHQQDPTEYTDVALTSAGATAVVDEWETQSQADPTGFHVNVLEINSSSLAAVNLALSAGTIVTGAAEAGTL